MNVAVAVLAVALAADFSQEVGPIRPEIHSSGFGPTICSQTEQDLADLKSMGFKYARTHDWALINHKYITTGTAEDKFGIPLEDMETVVNQATELPHIELLGLHFHIGSQITSMLPYVMLCETVNHIQEHFEQQGIRFQMINMGGGLGVDYSAPDDHLIPDFKQYFDIFKQHLHTRPGQQFHFELGRSIVCQCGSLICRTIFIKENRNKKFAIVDAGMTDLIRPALYQAHHEIQNLTSADTAIDTYDIVGPVCESSDVFSRDCHLPITRRGDLLAIRSAGAYGESMSSTYNMRSLPQSIFSDRL